MKKTICSLVAGLMIGGCAIAKAEGKTQPTFQHHKKVYIRPLNENYCAFMYDLDNDGVGDIIEIYKVVYCSNGDMVLELKSIGEDKNKDGVFTGDEIRIISDNYVVNEK